jgi:glycosyltransferase involved in cell wall biosynthesis
MAPAVANLNAGVRLIKTPLGPYRLGNYSATFSAMCLELGRESELLHTHGLWLHPNFATSAAAKALNKPAVISPRGMLADWALARGRFRKRLVWHLFQRRCLNAAAFVHATGEAEACEIRRAGISAPIAVIPNGVDLSGFPQAKLDELRAAGRSRRVLFLSRVHPKKGLDVLLAAWGIVAPKHPDAELVVAGPGEPQHISALRLDLSREGFERATYVGMVEGQHKLELLARSAVVILPSRNENYGMVVAEALACGTPVITSNMVPWPELESRGCGWRTGVDVDAVAQALDDALSRERRELDEMGFRGRALIEEAHTTALSATRMELAYSWVCGRGERPTFVV